MGKIRIDRNDSIVIANKKYDRLCEVPKGHIDYDKWVDFIETHKDYFVWYEDTPNGIDAKKNIDKVPDWARERVLYYTNRTNAYSTDKVVKNPSDFIVKFIETNCYISIIIERYMTKNIAKILFEMADYLEGKVIINGNKILESIEQLE
jgi:hypothetical protein